MRKTREEYAKIRERTSNRKTNIEYLSYQQALDNRLQLNWSTYQPPVPSFTGSRMIEKVDLKEVRNFIDWTPFFIAWNLVGKYPRIFQDEVVGEAAQTLFDEAQVMLDKLINEDLIQARALFGFWPATRSTTTTLSYMTTMASHSCSCIICASSQKSVTTAPTAVWPTMSRQKTAAYKTMWAALLSRRYWRRRAVQSIQGCRR